MPRTSLPATPPVALPLIQRADDETVSPSAAVSCRMPLRRTIGAITPYPGCA